MSKVTWMEIYNNLEETPSERYVTEEEFKKHILEAYQKGAFMFDPYAYHEKDVQYQTRALEYYEDLIKPTLEPTPETVQIKLKKIVKSDEACTKLGFNPYCVNEGADGEQWIEVELEDARNWGLI